MNLEDAELKRIAGALKRIDELYEYMMRGGFSEDEITRILTYVKTRKSWFFDWINRE